MGRTIADLNHTPPPPLPSRLARLCTWLALTLTWFAAHVLALFAPNEAKRRLAKYTRWAGGLLVARAMKQLRQWRAAPRPPHSMVIFRKLTLRRIAGGALRRALRASDPIARARAIYAILTNPDRWLAHLVRRLKPRFTKLS